MGIHTRHEASWLGYSDKCWTLTIALLSFSIVKTMHGRHHQHQFTHCSALAITPKSVKCSSVIVDLMYVLILRSKEKLQHL